MLNKLSFALLIFSIGLFGILGNYVFYNPSPSIPKGYYLSYPSNNYNRGDLIIFRLTNRQQITTLEKLRHLLYNNYSFTQPLYLIKHIVGVEHDIITINHNGIMVNNKLYSHSQAIDHYQNIYFNYLHNLTFKLKVHQFFVLGDTQYSYDSRYFGTITQQDIYRKALLLLTRDKPIW
jgi:conjugative transfer signal peptidase TraF